LEGKKVVNALLSEVYTSNDHPLKVWGQQDFLVTLLFYSFIVRCCICLLF